MRIKDWKLKTQLYTVFGIVVSLTLLLFGVSVHQAYQMADQLDKVYEHPMTVKTALYQIETALLDSGIELRNLTDPDNAEYEEDMIARIQLDYLHLEESLAIIHTAYLGPSTDIDAIEEAYVVWRAYRDTTISMCLAGDYEGAKDRLLPQGVGESYRLELMNTVQVVEDYANGVTQEVYSQFQTLFSQLMVNLSAIVIFIVGFKIAINSLLIHHINSPVIQLKKAALSFLDGNYDARVAYESRNEFGDLANSYNHMFTMIAEDASLQRMFDVYNDTYQPQEKPEDSIALLLQVLVRVTEMEAAGLYLLTEDGKKLLLHGSFGASGHIKPEYDLSSLEGDLAKVVAEKTMIYLEELDDQVHFIFPTAFGDVIPNTIVLIPIFSQNQLQALLTMASIAPIKQVHREFLKQAHESLSSRIEGIMADQKINGYLDYMEKQNRELEMQQSEMEQLNQELESQNTELEVQKQLLAEANQHKTSFLSTMSHELRTPLNSVIALSSVLERRLKGKIGDEEHSYLSIIERNGKALLALINDILDISRIESGRIEVHVVQFDPCETMEDMFLSMEAMAKQKGIALQTRCELGDIRMESDPDKFHHIVQNILGNAIKFTEKGSVSITSYVQNESIIIEVKDTGIGIPESVLPHIFEDFRQADTSTSRKYGGSGLGLAIAKRYAILLQGDITVESQEGEGSLFRIQLPLRIHSRTQPSSIRERISQPRVLVGKSSVLIVEDDPGMLAQLQDLIAHESMEIQTAMTVAEAKSAIQKMVPDALLLDIQLPDGECDLILESIRSHADTAQIPAIILTAKDLNPEELNRYESFGVFRILKKGEINRVDLLSAIFSSLQKTWEVSDELPPAEAPTILIVEDNPDNMITAVALLKDRFNIVQAVDGKQGVEVAKVKIPDLILMDIALPVMDGIKAFHAIRDIPKCAHIPIVALTASAMSSDRQEILSHGFDGFLSKPLNLHEFDQILKEVLYGK